MNNLNQRISNLLTIIELAQQELDTLRKQRQTPAQFHTSMPFNGPSFDQYKGMIREAQERAEPKVYGAFPGGVRQTGCQMPQGHPSHCGCPDFNNPLRDNIGRP